MQSFKRCIRDLTTNYKCFINGTNFLKPSIAAAKIHTSPKSQDYANTETNNGPQGFLSANKKIYPVQEPGEERRPAFVRHAKFNIKYSPKTMWYIASLVRGLTVDEAVKQLSFCMKKGAAVVKETILEAQQMAVEDHNVEFKTNLWVAGSFSTKGKVIKGVRRHAKGRVGHISYRYVHYFVQLEEGKPPKNYYLPAPKNKEELIDDWLVRMRKRIVPNSL